MALGTNTYSYLADYSQMASCLFAIQAEQSSGALNAYPELLKKLKIFEAGVIKKLYTVTLTVLGKIEGDIIITEGYILGDFDDIDFSSYDFHVGYADGLNTGYSSKFQTVLNVFKDFSERESELNDTDRISLETVLIPVLDEFDELQSYLNSLGLNICIGYTQANYFNNSKGIFLQAAGSDGSNGIVEGVHLRWSLTGELGDHHLPQGNYANSLPNLVAFNRANDFVSVYRTPYTDAVRIVLDFETDKPAVNYPLKRWTYNLNTTINGKVFKNRIRLYFKDAVLYDNLAMDVNPIVNSFQFLKQYNGVVELELSYKTAFLISFDFRKNSSSTSGKLKFDAYSAVPELNENGDEMPVIRKTVLVNSTNPIAEEIFGDNIKRIKLKKSSDGYLQSFSFETYDDFLQVKQNADWTLLGDDFALSLNNTEVFERLENINHPIDHLWPQYNEGTTVKIANYQDKWTVDRANDPSIKSTVTKYLTLSENDPRAEEIIKLENVVDAEELLISYVDVLSVLALDFHIARMLGLGTIDFLESSSTTEKFIYKVSYKNAKSLQSTELVDYEFLSLPTSKSDNRLPVKPELQPISYKLPINNELSATLFDSDGYSTNDHTRAINIARLPHPYEIGDEEFFENLTTQSTGFNMSENIVPVFYGIEYRADNQANYVKPEITTENFVNANDSVIYYAYDTNFPLTGVPETAPVPDNTTSLYVHLEKQSGIHHYAVYSINWFSRASVLSDELTTDETVFPLKNLLQPPLDLSVQYIQEEDTLLFTTQTEQDWLKGRIENFEDGDINFTRLTFNWLDVTDLSQVQDVQHIDFLKISRPNKIKAYFKEDLPLEIKGIIADTDEIPGDDLKLLLYTDKYNLIDGTEVIPQITVQDQARFLNGLLTTTEGKFKVVAVAAGVNGPVITVEKIVTIENIEDPNEPGTYSSAENQIYPEIGSKFSLVENLSESGNWDEIVEEIELIDFVDEVTPVIETETDSEGNLFHYLIGGITDSALVNRLKDVNDEIIPGYYKIAFENQVLNLHPQINIPFDVNFPLANSPDILRTPHVEWYKGLVRMRYADGEIKILEVVRIEQLNPLVIYVLDPGYQDKEMPLSQSPTNYLANINYHPGYKAYLFPEPSPNAFNKSNILPQGNVNQKKTLIGLQTFDERVGGTGFKSTVSLPAVLLARKVEKTVQLDPPIVYSLKVRPDITAKAAFTFDVKLAPDANGQVRTPFGFSFYRINSEDLLAALYNEATINSIKEDLSLLTTDLYYNTRFLDLVNLVFDPVQAGQFKVYEAEPQDYGFPVPDKTGLTEPGDSIIQKKEKYRLAIFSRLLPLTEQTPIFDFIKPGLQTENKIPIIRDIDGNLLGSTDDNFDPFPMIRKYPKQGEVNTTYIRFTDYTLHGSSRSLYFYACVELDSKLVPGPLSSFAGPVTVLQTLPSSAPAIRSFTISSSAGTNGAIAVIFQLSPFSVEEHISKIRIYRSTDKDALVYLQNIEYLEIEIDNDGISGLDIIDDFSDFTIIPFGEIMYYRLVGVRTIINEYEESEDVLTIASDTIKVKLVEFINPDAPELTYIENTNKLTWQPTIYSGKYFVYKQNSRGNWEKLETIAAQPEISSFEYSLPVLPAEDEDGDPIYHRYKVNVENASGLLNLVDKEITI